MSKIVTGGAGFIGFYIVERCTADEYEVVIIDKVDDHYLFTGIKKEVDGVWV